MWQVVDILKFSKRPKSLNASCLMTGLLAPLLAIRIIFAASWSLPLNVVCMWRRVFPCKKRGWFPGSARFLRPCGTYLQHAQNVSALPFAIHLRKAAILSRLDGIYIGVHPNPYLTATTKWWCVSLSTGLGVNEEEVCLLSPQIRPSFTPIWQTSSYAWVIT